MSKPYLEIVAHYEGCLERHGDTHLGVDWPKPQDVETRYRVMLEVLRPGDRPAALLDFGCGAGHLYEYIVRQSRRDIAYHGLDISPKFIDLCRHKHPSVPFTCADVLDPTVSVPAADYVVMNGVFTEKRGLTFDAMLAYFQAVLRKVFTAARVGVAFNVISKQVDWERDDLFHLPLDTMAWFVTRELSRNFVVRNDYGLYEYTTYLYK
jgi:SAM-dependent methyltransferase